MQNLNLHPGCTPGPVESVSASIVATAKGCRVQFTMHGNLQDIRIPALDEPGRTDELWKTTCFEIFWQPQGGTEYTEFNLSPSSKWAAYQFDSFRKNGRDAPIQAIAVASAHSHEQLLLTADIAADLPVPATVALNAIVEKQNGIKQYWALAFGEGQPDFHSSECRVLRIEDRL